MLVNAIWDFDGTLYDSYPGMMKALAALVTAVRLNQRRSIAR